MCAVGLHAIEYQIWKEVDGIYTADPRKVPSARLLTTVTAEEAAELTFFGSEVHLPVQLVVCCNLWSNINFLRSSILSPWSNSATRS
jgi:aspartate kinase